MQRFRRDRRSGKDSRDREGSTAQDPTTRVVVGEFAEDLTRMYQGASVGAPAGTGGVKVERPQRSEDERPDVVGGLGAMLLIEEDRRAIIA